MILKLIKNNFVFLIFILFFLAFVFLTYKDYGITWDESDTYNWGIITKNFVTRKISYKEYVNKLGLGNYISPIYFSLLSFINKGGLYEKFHLLNLLLSLSIFFINYSIVKNYYKSQILAIIGPIFLFLTPRFLGDIPANPKDIPFAIFYFLSLSGIYFFNKNKKNRSLVILILGILFGITQSMRLVGLTLYLIFFIYSYYFRYKNKFNFKNSFQIILEAGLIFIFSSLIMIIIWPYLWVNTIEKIKEIILIQKKFFWNGLVLFNGKNILAKNLPSYYLFIWFFIATPVYILFFLFFSYFFVKKKNNLFWLFSLALLTNLLIYLILKPIIYDGLRHYLFLFPIIVTISTISFIEFIKYFRHNFIKKIIFFCILINILFVIKNIVKLHPYEYVYFNELIGGLKGAYGKFETDYWGASYREAVIWLRNYKANKNIKVYTCGHPFQSIYYFSSNMSFVPIIEKADYFVCYTRFNQDKTVNWKIIHEVKRFDIPLNIIKERKI